MTSYVASHLKDMNRHIVFNLINELEVTSRAEISKRTGISAPTVLKIVSFLAEEGLVLELGEGESSLGRKPHMLTLNRDKLYSAVFFIEGELLKLGVVNIVGEISYQKTLRCEPNLGGIINRICNGLVDGLFAEAGISLDKLMGIGIALPGMYDNKTKTVITAPLVGISEPTCIREYIHNLEQKYNVLILVENDVNCQCLGEFKVTKMPEDSDLLMISVGTGLGASIILNGKLRHGVNNMCGEIGYMSFEDDFIARLGSPGWLERKLCLRVLEKKFGISYDTDIAGLSEETFNAVLEYISLHLALCISNMTMILDCPNVRLSGVVVELLGEKLIERINDKIVDMCISEIKLQNQHSIDIGLIGISAILTEKHISRILMEKNKG